MILSGLKSILWKGLLALIFIRPFLSEYAFLNFGFWYVSILIAFFALYLAFNRKANLVTPGLSLAVFLYMVAVLISIIYCGFTHWTLYEFYLLLPNLLIFYIATLLKPGQEKQLINIIIFAACAISLYALYQYFIGFGHLSEYLKKTGPNLFAEQTLLKQRVFATFISPNIFAGYLVMMLFMAMGCLASSSQIKMKIIYSIGIFLMASALILTKSFGGILAFIAGLLLFIFCTAYYLLPSLKLRRGSLIKANLIVAFITLVFVFTFIFLIWRRLPEFLNPSHPENPLIQRLYYWKASLNMIKTHPFWGIGWRRFGLWYEYYKVPAANVSHYAHNIILQVMTETGFLGFFSFLCIVGLFINSGLRQIKNNNSSQGLKIGLFCAGCAFLFHNLVDISFYFGQASFFWWLSLGLFNGPFAKSKES